MVRITEELVRKKSEHNELIIGTLEEISLHQEDIEKIENIQNWCRDLKILLLQSNLISKIENLYKLKKLEYLNLAINCIERIENLEKLESLEKLDLTLNYIGELTSVQNLKDNYNLKHLILTGNPCTEFKGYRNYVITILPQLQTFDNVEIKLSDKIKAKNLFKENQKFIVQEEIEYKIERDEQKIRVAKQKLQFDKKLKNLNDEERSKLFWDSKSENCPETRYEIAKEHRRSKNLADGDKTDDKIKNEPKLFSSCGRPYNINQAKLEFKFSDEPQYYEVELYVYKYLDTSLINVDAQPNYLRITIKGKIFQLAFNDEINVSESTTKRSQITGHLVVFMPKISIRNGIISCEKSLKKFTVEKSILRNNQASYLKGTVNYKNIVKSIREESSLIQESNDEIELPALI